MKRCVIEVFPSYRGDGVVMHCATCHENVAFKGTFTEAEIVVIAKGHRSAVRNTARIEKSWNFSN